MQTATLVQLQWIVWPLLATTGALGLTALVSPRHFERCARASSKWIDTRRLLAALDKTIYIDHYVLRFARWFGCAVLVACLVLAYFYHVAVAPLPCLQLDLIAIIP